MAIENEDLPERLRVQSNRSRNPEDAGLMREAAEAVEGLRLGYHNAPKNKREPMNNTDLAAAMLYEVAKVTDTSMTSGNIAAARAVLRGMLRAQREDTTALRSDYEGRLEKMHALMTEVQEQRSETEKRLDALVQERDDLRDMLETAWGIIANANGGDWETASQDWQDAAARFRDAYHETLRA